ncbi:MAG: glycosyltransferase, partial [Methanophagales archaeon]|nr:glycosyltransferase [Methanophagales archaeon]
MKILYSWGHGNKREKSFIEEELKRWINAGYEITPLNDREELGIMNPWAPDELDRLYRNKDERLIKLYNKVRMLAKTHDIFIVNFGNVYHPEFVKSLKDTSIYSVITSGDDPESSDWCSKPYVYAFDHAFAFGVNFDKDTKITEKFLEWGAKRADWWSYGAREDMYDPSLAEDDIYNNDRDIDLIFVGSPWLKLERLARIKRAFPQMKIYGQRYWKTIVGSGIDALRGGNSPKEAFKAVFAGLWRVKELPMDELVPLYLRCKIGINIHLSYGPSNRRIYQLPANGVMQICDCPEGLGQVYEIGKEVITYHSIEEAIEL